MPIKLPKGFSRRKSSGNALEGLENQPEPSFRVFERPRGSGRSVDGPSSLKRTDESRVQNASDDPHPDNIFMGIEESSSENRYVFAKYPRESSIAKWTGSSGDGSTNSSASTGGLYDSASSTKFSSSSTLPSSTDVPIHDIPVPPIRESQFSLTLRAAGRRLSFGSKAPKGLPQEQNGHQPIESVTRDRAMTASTTSTATPKLLASNLNLGESSGFVDIFEGIGKRKNRIQDSGSPSPNSEVRDPGSLNGPYNVNIKESKRSKSSLLSALRIDHSNDVERAAYSHVDQNSEEIPICSPDSQDRGRGFSHKSITPPRNPGLSDTSANSQVKYGVDSSKGRRKNTTPPGQRNSRPIEDEDAKIVNGLLSANGRTLRRHSALEDKIGESVDVEALPLYDDDQGNRGLASGSNPWHTKPAPQPRKPLPATPDDEGHIDCSLSTQARLAARYAEDSIPEKLQNKVMTPAQFERYRLQQELTRRQRNVSSAQLSDDDSDNYDDDDEADKSQQAANQRRKQEAHLSVYRQQMMKVTGEQSATMCLEQNSSTLDKAGMSTPNLMNRLSTFGFEKRASGKFSDVEDDEDIPLAILAAHGFPNKNRPPTRLAASSSNPNLRASMQPVGPGPSSLSGEPIASTNRGNLPIFARHLPQDPYYGANLVSQSNRESLALGGGSPAFAGTPSGLPPGGLVSVIANEERAKAMRRGSPNARGGYDVSTRTPVMNVPNSIQSQQVMNMANTGPIGLPPTASVPGQHHMLSPGDQAQIQISQQMTQMMQMQMQWMQQMMQMQAMQTGQSAAMANSSDNFLGSPGLTMRPISMASNGTFTNSPGAPQVDQRTLSLLDPSMSSKGNNNRSSSFIPTLQGTGSTGRLSAIGGLGYTPSIAPSERSNIGTASRYRPVSTIQPDSSNSLPARSSTFTAPTLQPWTEEPPKLSLSSLPISSSDIIGDTSIAPMAGKPVSDMAADSLLAPNDQFQTNMQAAPEDDDDDDDDEGWAEMMQMREKRKSTWKFKKGPDGFGDLVHHTEI